MCLCDAGLGLSSTHSSDGGRHVGETAVDDRVCMSLELELELAAARASVYEPRRITGIEVPEMLGFLVNGHRRWVTVLPVDVPSVFSWHISLIQMSQTQS